MNKIEVGLVADTCKHHKKEAFMNSLATISFSRVNMQHSYSINSLQPHQVLSIIRETSLQLQELSKDVCRDFMRMQLCH